MINLKAFFKRGSTFKDLIAKKVWYKSEMLALVCLINYNFIQSPSVG